MLVALLMLASFTGGAVALSPNAYAAPGCKSNFLTFPAWYDGLTDSSCRLKSPSDLNGPEKSKLSRYIFRVVLNVLDMALQLVAYISVGYIMYGGFKWLTSASDSSKIAGARKTIQNALIGLVISILSVAIVNLIANNIT